MNSDAMKEIGATLTMMERAAKESESILDPREIEIIKMRLGIETKKPKTLSVIGKKFGITRERVRQIQNEVTKKVKSRLQYCVMLEEIQYGIKNWNKKNGIL
jgi:DNA-directed RNA polymerase sigma subunit (sigma70/sigma32)